MPEPAPGKIRVFAVAGTAGLVGGRWHDVTPSNKVDGLIRAGLLKLTGPKGEAPPARIVPACCGARDR